MTDRLEEEFSMIDGPRALDADFRARLESALTESRNSSEARGAEPRDRLWRIDGPRDLPPHLRTRLEKAITKRRRFAPGPLMTSAAAAVAVLLVASTVALTSASRTGPGRPVSAPPIVVDDVNVPPHREPPPPPPAPAPRPPGSLQGFASSRDFLRYVRGEALKLAGPYGIRGVSIYPAGRGGPQMLRAAPATAESSSAAAASASPQFSTTNIQEEGVDEPDIAKTDGRRLVVVSYGKAWFLDVTRGGARLLGSLNLEGGIGLFLAGDRVVHFGSTYAASSPDIPASPWTKVTVINIARADRPEIVSSLKVEGSYVAARMVGGIVRLVVSSSGLGPQPVPLGQSETGYSEEALQTAEAANKQAIQKSGVGEWLPGFVLERPKSKPVTGKIHGWEAVSRPPDQAGVSMLSIMTIDPADPSPDNAVSVIGSGEIVYSSLQNLYVTTQRIDDLLAIDGGAMPANPITRIHKFDISDPRNARYLASGETPGYLLNQFAMSEYAGHLRVATTLGHPWMGPEGGLSESFVKVFSEEKGRLVPVGSVGNLGRGEQIRSVRFIGPMGYVVTFRQVDPLYVVDLHNPKSPELKGELKVPGYSGYLHPLGETLLLGIGRDADESGRAKGIQFSLFDVSDPRSPRRIHDRTFGTSGQSYVENDHRSFLYWEPKSLISVPAEIFDEANQNSEPFVGALALTARRDSGFTEAVRLTHRDRPGIPDGYTPPISRSLVIGNGLVTISEVGVLFSDLNTFADRVWVPLGT